MTKIYHTRKAIEAPPYGAFEDEIIIQVQDSREIFVMRKYEFEWLAQRLFDNWQQQRCAYIQILKEWNECIGFQDLAGQASWIEDKEETIAALKLVKFSTEKVYNQIEPEDVEHLLEFLERNKNEQVEIRER